jgi:hypothetical protein
MKFGLFIRTRIGSVQGHRTENLGEVCVSEDKRKKFNYQKKKGKKKSLKRETSIINDTNPRTLKVFIQIVLNNNSGKYEFKISRGRPPELRPCETLKKEVIHETIGKSPEVLLAEAKKIGERLLREVLDES